MTVHWKAPLQAKGFLKIIEMLVALLALALVAGYSSTAIIHCPQDPTGFTDTTITTSYPFQQYIKFNASSSSVTTPSSGTVIRTPPKAYPLDPSISQSAQFFVAWGSLTLIYGVVALLVYMCVTANEQLQQVFDFLVYCDLVFHIVWVLCWFIASIEWAIAYRRLDDQFIQLANDTFNTVKDGCSPDASAATKSLSIDVQAAIGDVFGFLSVFLWAVNIFWVVIDTSFYIRWKANRSGMMSNAY